MRGVLRQGVMRLILAHGRPPRPTEMDGAMLDDDALSRSTRVAVGDPLRIDDELLEVLESGRFGVQYEPIVDIATGETIAYEALARFHGADGRTFSPAKVFAWLHGAPSLLVETEL